ncbi:MAG TPA: hypothetical protein VFT55_08280 [Planctomycetota bacterium]|nr:hypothetical protein [Planctomycetota bacterium]
MTLRVTGSPAVGQTFNFATTGGPPQTPGLLVLAMQPAHIPLPGSTVTALIGLDPTATWQSLVLDASGAYSLPVAVPQVPSLAGFRGFVQVAVHNGTSFFASNGLEVVICP